MHVRFVRALVLTSVVVGGVVGPAAISFAAAGDPIPGIDVSLEQIPGGLVTATNPIPPGVPIKPGAKVPPEVTITPALTATPQTVTVAVKGPKNMAGYTKVMLPPTTTTWITAVSGKLTGQMDCQMGSLTARTAWTPPSGKIALKYAATNPATGKPYTSTAYVRMTPGHDDTRNDDVAFVGTVTSGLGAGQSFVLDQLLQTPGTFDWWNCSQGGPAVSALNLSSDVGTAPTNYNGFLAIGCVAGIGVTSPNTGSIVIEDPSTGGSASCAP